MTSMGATQDKIYSAEELFPRRYVVDILVAPLPKLGLQVPIGAFLA